MNYCLFPLSLLFFSKPKSNTDPYASPLQKNCNQPSAQFVLCHSPSQQFGCTREVSGRHIFNVMHVSQGVLDYKNIAIFQIRVIAIFQFAQQNIGQRQVHENFPEDSE
jgi:hypothetical protein